MLALHLNEFATDDFDYIIIDEAHHAADNSYTKIINYFTPKFLLGLTATPERTDGKDIFGIFDFNRAVNIRLRDSLEKDLVCPFHYFGIKEVEGIDYTTLKHNPEDGEEYLNEVSSLLMKSKRVDYILDKINFYKHDGDKTKALGFCATVKHAEFMAEEFNKILGQGSAIALSGNNSVSERQKYLKELESDDTNLKYIFTRDIFNEGIDIQDVNLVLMLRPTQSSIVFTQQLGRGLRKIKGKEFLTVLDFIGNYQKSFLVTSVFSKEPNPDKKTRLREVATDFNDIPGDTFIHFDPIVKDQILRQIDSEKFMSDLNQKKAYFTFRKDIGNKIGRKLTGYFKESLSFIKEVHGCMGLMLCNSFVGAVDILLLFFLQAKLPEKGIPQWELGIALLFMEMGGIVGSKLILKLPKIRYKWVYTIAVLLVSAGFIAEHSPCYYIMALGGFIAAIGDDALQVRTNAILQDMFPSEQRATLTSIESFSFSAIMIVLSPLAGFVFTYW